MDMVNCQVTSPVRARLTSSGDNRERSEGMQATESFASALPWPNRGARNVGRARRLAGGWAKGAT